MTRGVAFRYDEYIRSFIFLFRYDEYIQLFLIFTFRYDEYQIMGHFMRYLRLSVS